MKLNSCTVIIFHKSSFWGSPKIREKSLEKPGGLMKAVRPAKRIVFIHRQLTVNSNDKCPEMNEDLINVPGSMRI